MHEDEKIIKCTKKVGFTYKNPALKVLAFNDDCE